MCSFRVKSGGRCRLISIHHLRPLPSFHTIFSNRLWAFGGLASLVYLFFFPFYFKQQEYSSWVIPGMSLWREVQKSQWSQHRLRKKNFMSLLYYKHWKKLLQIWIQSMNIHGNIKIIQLLKNKVLSASLVLIEIVLMINTLSQQGQLTRNL